MLRTLTNPPLPGILITSYALINATLVFSTNYHRALLLDAVRYGLHGFRLFRPDSNSDSNSDSEIDERPYIERAKVEAMMAQFERVEDAWYDANEYLDEVDFRDGDRYWGIWGLDL